MKPYTYTYLISIRIGKMYNIIIVLCTVYFTKKFIANIKYNKRITIEYIFIQFNLLVLKVLDWSFVAKNFAYVFACNVALISWYEFSFTSWIVFDFKCTYAIWAFAGSFSVANFLINWNVLQGKFDKRNIGFAWTLRFPFLINPSASCILLSYFKIQW